MYIHLLNSYCYKPAVFKESLDLFVPDMTNPSTLQIIIIYPAISAFAVQICYANKFLLYSSSTNKAKIYLYSIFVQQMY